jgi:uncharacterized membrane protein YkvA (DUF1232 family)
MIARLKHERASSHNAAVSLTATLKARAKQLKAEVTALYYAARHPRTPWYAKAFIAAIVAYALSPIDLIPDFIPVLGFVDEIVLLPFAIVLAIRLVPADVMAECRARANDSGRVKSAVGRFGAAFIVVLWIAAIWLVGAWLYEKLYG